ncbi:MAG: Rrf2 family transcriptional regulator [Acutalibacteraceae bacterium]|nr:Rrf2 family transcriptional regulator [Acutalibacteraceae bacterium]
MMVSTKGRYALRVLIDLALHQRDEYVSLKGIAERQDVSMKYLENIVATLSKAGYLESLRGKNGGYRLKEAPDKYTIGSVLKLTEGTLAPVACLENCSTEECSRSASCLTLPLWHKLDNIVNEYLDSVTIADLINKTIEI